MYLFTWYGKLYNKNPRAVKTACMHLLTLCCHGMACGKRASPVIVSLALQHHIDYHPAPRVKGEGKKDVLVV